MLGSIIKKEPKAKAHHHPCKLMGCGFVLTAVHTNPQHAWDAIRAAETEIERIENLISSWKSCSQTSLINEMSGIAPVKVKRELYELILRSKKISQITAGAFDICGNLSRYYWRFDKGNHEMLSEECISEMRSLMNYRNIDLNPYEQTVYLKKKGMKIGFGGIGKGYAALRAQKVMHKLGIQSGLINASGDIMCWGIPPNKKQWPVNVPNPHNRQDSLLQFSIPYGSVVTSGNYENYTVINGTKYSHIIDPRTAYPVENIKNVSVVSPDPEFADAMATAISVMGVEEGLNIVDKIKGIECIIIDNQNNIHYSRQFKSFDICEN